MATNYSLCYVLSNHPDGHPTSLPELQINKTLSNVDVNDTKTMLRLSLGLFTGDCYKWHWWLIDTFTTLLSLTFLLNPVGVAEKSFKSSDESFRFQDGKVYEGLVRSSKQIFFCHLFSIHSIYENKPWVWTE